MKSSFVVGVTLIVAHLHLHVQSFSTIARDSVEFSRQRTTAQSGSCQFVAPTADGSACNIFDLSGLPNVVYNISDSWPEPYLVASPCHTVDTSKCPACAQATPAGVVQLLVGTRAQSDVILTCMFIDHVFYHDQTMRVPPPKLDRIHVVAIC